MLGLCWESQLGYRAYTRVGIPSPDIAGQHLLLVLAEPGVPGLAALTLPDEAVIVLVQGQEGCPCPLSLLGCQQPQKGILGGQISEGVEYSSHGNLPPYIPKALGVSTLSAMAIGVSPWCHRHSHQLLEPALGAMTMGAVTMCDSHGSKPWMSTIPVAVFSEAAGWTRGRGSPATQCAPSCLGPGR